LKSVYFSQLMIVGAGGFIGSALRFMIGGWAQRVAAAGVFPYGTLVVNVVGCLLIGFLGGLAEYRQALEPAHRLFLMIGVLGGFTTFSAFAFETIGLMQDAQVLKAVVNTGLQVILGFTAAFVGYLGARFI
jgi:CrcB protein